MGALIQLYWPTVLAAALAAAALSMVGALLATRRAGLQALPVSQSAALGVSVGLLVVESGSSHGHLEHTILPLVSGLAAGAGGFWVSEWLSARSSSPAVVQLAIFTFCWCLGQLMQGLFPVIESHHAALFFGDLVTLTAGESYFFALLAGGSLAFLLIPISRHSELAFLASTLNEPMRLSRHPLDLGFQLVALLLLCFSVQMLGLFFTLSCLFLPTVVYSFSPAVGAKRHLVRLASTSFLAAGAAFFLSLSEPRLLTTPLIALFIAMFPLAHITLERWFIKMQMIRE